MATEDWMLSDDSPYEDAEPYNAIRDLKDEVKRLVKVADEEREAAFDRGVRDTLARLAGPEALRAACLIDASDHAAVAGVPRMPDDEAVAFYGPLNRRILAAVAAALAPREETER